MLAACVLPKVLLFTWMQVGEAVQSQALDIEAHLELKRSCLHQGLSQQPAVLLPCNRTTTHTHTQTFKINHYQCQQAVTLLSLQYIKISLHVTPHPLTSDLP